jgi:uncharacterized protein (TIGR00369 family)
MTKSSLGHVEIDAPIAGAILNQHGFAHAGFGFSLADIAARYAAITHLPIDHNILTVEPKINYLAPAKGDKLCAVGRVIRPGRRLSVVAADLFAITEKNQQKGAILKSIMIPGALKEAQGVRSF